MKLCLHTFIALTMLCVTCMAQKKDTIKHIDEALWHDDSPHKAVLTGKPVPPYRSLNTFNGDTAQYLKYNYKLRYEAYVGKKVGSLLETLEVPIKNYLPTKRTINHAGYFNEAILISHYNPMEFNKRLNQNKYAGTICIYFANPYPYDTAFNFYRQNGQWDNKAVNFYKDLIISDVSIVE